MEEREAQWIEKALTGDDNAFGNLVETYQIPVFSLCYRMLGNSHDAEDAAQEAFLRAYQNLQRYDPSRSFATWLLSIASHHCIDRMRKRQLPAISTDVLPAEILPDHHAPNPEKKMQKRENEAMIENLLRNLKPIDRAAIILRYWHECSEVEIADSLNLTVSAVKSRLFRSRQALADAWLASEHALEEKERSLLESPSL